MEPRGAGAKISQWARKPGTIRLELTVSRDTRSPVALLDRKAKRPMEKLKSIVDDAMGELDGSLPADQAGKIARVIEAAVIRGMLEGQHRAVDACKEIGEAEQDVAHKVATAIREKNDLLIVNLSSLR